MNHWATVHQAATAARHATWAAGLPLQAGGFGLVVGCRPGEEAQQGGQCERFQGGGLVGVGEGLRGRRDGLHHASGRHLTARMKWARIRPPPEGRCR
ncbi:hypothetical protein ABZ468_47280 [Streptomyces sp. NPDC005708]|uniref:hypothetical protein n=1 Tax=Streptomyces sp. NPDC005708 TaxID=3154564 RepID=UPI0033F0BC07